jgi:hypothetical protein
MVPRFATLGRIPKGVWVLGGVEERRRMGPALAVYHRAGAKRAVGFWFMHQDGLEVSVIAT